MQLNGLSLKRDDTFEPSGFIHTGTLRPEIFCNFPQQPEDFDPAFFPLFGRPMDSHEIRRLRTLPDHASLHLGI